MASCTRSRVDLATMSGRLSTFDTVPTETPARAATSLMLTGAFTDILSGPDRQCLGRLGTCQLPAGPASPARRAAASQACLRPAGSNRRSC